MIYTLLNKIDALKPVTEVKAHCDIPCKIYDPSSAIIAALTMLRMVDLITETEAKDKDLSYHNSMARFIATKEQHGIKLKEEVNIIWGDYFKTPQMEKFPEIHELTHNIMMTASKCKQEIDREKTLELIDLVNRFAEIFWATKEVKTKRATCPYPPSVEVVYPDL